MVHIRVNAHELKAGRFEMVGPAEARRMPWTVIERYADGSALVDDPEPVRNVEWAPVAVPPPAPPRPVEHGIRYVRGSARPAEPAVPVHLVFLGGCAPRLAPITERS